MFGDYFRSFSSPSTSPFTKRGPGALSTLWYNLYSIRNPNNGDWRGFECHRINCFSFYSNSFHRDGIMVVKNVRFSSPPFLAALCHVKVALRLHVACHCQHFNFRWVWQIAFPVKATYIHDSQRALHSDTYIAFSIVSSSIMLQTECSSNPTVSHFQPEHWA